MSMLSMFKRSLLRSPRKSVAAQARVPFTSQEYWSSYNVTGHKVFQTKQESLRYSKWRADQYIDYLSYMPLAGQDGKVVLDYGCGPGHDLVGFVECSKPLRLIGMDVSRPSLEQAKHRLALHGAEPELFHIEEEPARLPLPDASVDYIHCSGVLHHVPDPIGVLREFRRILKVNGSSRIMVYNYDCVWLHLFAAYRVRLKQQGGKSISVLEAFKRNTDTAECPISHAWTDYDVKTMCREGGFVSQHLGNAVSVRELAILPDRFEAILNQELEEEHRNFLLSLTFDNRGVPFYQGYGAGIDGCYLLTTA